MSEYTTNRAINGTLHGQPLCLDLSPPSFLLRDGHDEWLCEWHGYCGPILLDKRTGDPRDKQPPEGHRWWTVIQAWHDQGARVVDGVGVWSEPVKVTHKYRRITKGQYLRVADDATGPDIVEIADQR